MKKTIQCVCATALPKYQTSQSAGADLTSAAELTLLPGATSLVPTGLSLAIPEHFEAQVRSRSGLASKGIVVLNSPGTIDADYRGEVKVLLHNFSTVPYTIMKGDRIAQIVFAPVVQADFQVVEKLDETDRGHGGFGSTGKS